MRSSDTGERPHPKFVNAVEVLFRLRCICCLKECLFEFCYRRRLHRALNASTNHLKSGWFSSLRLRFHQFR